MVDEGDMAPDFKLEDQEGNIHRLSGYRGKKVVLYFYPKDMTPGCTKEACSFRDGFSEFKKYGIVVLGVSSDSKDSHRKFSEKHSLPFTLLSDPEKEVQKKYGSFGEKKFMGRTFQGTLRKTFLIDEDGIIRKIFDKVKVEAHAGEVLDAFKSR